MSLIPAIDGAGGPVCMHDSVRCCWKLMEWRLRLSVEMFTWRIIKQLIIRVGNISWPVKPMVICSMFVHIDRYLISFIKFKNIILIHKCICISFFIFDNPIYSAHILIRHSKLFSIDNDANLLNHQQYHDFKPNQLYALIWDTNFPHVYDKLSHTPFKWKIVSMIII